jgi:hypothetical protein
MYTAQPFVIPSGMSFSEQINFCKTIIAKLRAETILLRKETLGAKGKIQQLEKDIERWKQKITTLRIGNEKLRQERDRLKKEEERLKKEIEKLTKTNNRYQVSLFDHGNFHHPDKKDKKPKGGQIGHKDTNREKHEDYASYGHKRVFAKTCGKCGCSLKRAKGIRQKILLDIVINPEIVKLIIESERQWCGSCQKEVSARDPQTLPFTEYGMNTFMLSMVLRFKAHASFANIATVMTISHGLVLAKSDVASLLKKGAGFLEKRYEELKEAVRKGEVMYNDETGWLVHGQKAWMWIMATSDKKQADGAIASGITVYVAAESRGKGIFKDMYGNSQSYSMHDGYAGYESITGKEKTVYCWTHVLRFAYEETVAQKQPTTLACQIRDRLVNLYQLIRQNRQWTKEQKEKVLREELARLIAITSPDQTVHNILHRITTQKEGLILALLVTEDGTNNLSERELRNMAIKRSISNGSDTYKGMETTAILGSVLQTLHRNKKLPFLPTLQTYVAEGIQEKYQQYIHIPYVDS